MLPRPWAQRLYYCCIHWSQESQKQLIFDYLKVVASLNDLHLLQRNIPFVQVGVRVILICGLGISIYKELGIKKRMVGRQPVVCPSHMGPIILRKYGDNKWQK